MKKIKIAINGFGRIGRAAFRILSERENCEVVAINDLTDNKTLAYLLKHDSVFRTYNKDISHSENSITVDGKEYPVFSNSNPAELPWDEYDVDVALECTGFFVKDDVAYAHIDAGAKRVVLSAPAKGKSDIETFVLGVNKPNENSSKVVSNASCTTNCIAPVIDVIHKKFGVEKSLMTTIHSYTSTQKLQDSPAKDLRKGRAAAQNMIPTTTGAVIAATKVIPDLAGKFDGMSVRVPTIDVSFADITFVLKKDVTVEDVNNTLIEAAAGELRGIVGVTEEPLVSGDFIGDNRSAIVDLLFTTVIGGNLVKVVAWYDNEWGYANRLVDMGVEVGKIVGLEG